MMSNDISNLEKSLALEGNVAESKYFFFDTNPLEKQKFAIIFGGYEKCAPDFHIKRKTYPYNVLEIPTAGQCSLSIDEQEYTLKKGTIGSFTSGVPHQYKCNPEHPMEHFFIVFTGNEADELIELNSFANGSVVKQNNPALVLFLAESILRAGLEKTELSHQLCCHYLKALLIEQSLHTAPSNKAYPMSISRYRQCRNYIDSNFSSITGTAEVAKACSMTTRYMSRLFKKYNDITPREYIMRLKLNKAASVLLTSSNTIYEVAAMVGFSDPYHFSRNFKNFHGISPQNYRDKHLE